jgi:hypothetical protein
MTVRAKFFVSTIKHVGTPGSEPCAMVELSPVYGSYGDGKDEENKTWSKYTPQGKIEMTITNQGAIDQFLIGRPYFVDFTPAD